MNIFLRKSSNSSNSTLRPPRTPAIANEDILTQEFHGGLHIATAGDLSSTVEIGSAYDTQQHRLKSQIYYHVESKDRKEKSLSGFLEEEKKRSLSGSFFRRLGKVCSLDVASVGNASDTAVSVSSSHYTSGRSMHEEAKILFNAGNYAGALPMFESILSAQVRRFSALHPSVGAAMHNVGVCRQRLGQHALAENLFDEAVRIRKQTLGPNHLDVAASISKLGTSQIVLQKLDEAYENLRLAIKISRANLGHEHKTVAQMQCHLACLFYEAGELMAAQSTFEDALSIYRAVWRNDDDRNGCMIQLTDTLCNIGSIQNRRMKLTDAIETFSEALELQQGVVSLDNVRIISTMDNLGYSFSKNKDYASALSCYRKILRAQLSQQNTFHSECLITFRKVILMHEKLRRFADAINEIKEAIHVQKTTNPRDHRMIMEMTSILEDIQKKSHSRSR